MIENQIVTTRDLCKSVKLNEDDVDYLNELSIYTSNNVQDRLLKFEQLDAEIEVNKEKTKDKERKMTKDKELIINIYLDKDLHFVLLAC